MSEHTIDGKHTDLEMHIVHMGEKDYKGRNPGDVKYAAVGIMFSKDDYTADYTSEEMDVIDTFFDSLVWIEQEKNPRVEEV